jgi:hypothetical protein
MEELGLTTNAIFVRVRFTDPIPFDPIFSGSSQKKF